MISVTLNSIKSMECILEKLRRDLTQASLEYATEKHIDLDKEWLHQRITNKLSETKISFYRDPPEYGMEVKELNAPIVE